MLSPLWVEHLIKSGWQAVHWPELGDIRAPDTGPSVIQIRIQDVFPDKLASRVVKILLEYQTLLEKIALAVIDEQKSRIRILPLR